MRITDIVEARSNQNSEFRHATDAHIIQHISEDVSEEFIRNLTTKPYHTAEMLLVGISEERSAALADSQAVRQLVTKYPKLLRYFPTANRGTYISALAASIAKDPSDSTVETLATQRHVLSHKEIAAVIARVVQQQ